jgi:hypothetical protein
MPNLQVGGATAKVLAHSAFGLVLLATVSCAAATFDGKVFGVVTAASVGQAYLHPCSRPTSDCASVHVDEENDAFVGNNRDDQYTNGIGIFADRNSSPHWVRAATGSIPAFTRAVLWSRTRDCDSISSPQHCLVSSFGFVQGMYTPTTKSPTAPDVTDRPYAGVLVSRFQLTRQADTDATTIAISAGVIGKASAAEQVQDAIHGFLGLTTFNGWRNQIANGPIASIEFARRRRFERDLPADFNVDATPVMGGVAGNLMDYARLGSEFRIGYRLSPSWGEEKLTQVIEAQSHNPLDSVTHEQRAQQPRRTKVEFGLLVVGEVRGVAYNATLDRTPPTVSQRWARHNSLVDESGGGAFASVKLSEFRYTAWLPDVSVGYRVIERSPEIQGATLGYTATHRHAYGVFTISTRRPL